MILGPDSQPQFEIPSSIKMERGGDAVRAVIKFGARLARLAFQGHRGLAFRGQLNFGQDLHNSHSSPAQSLVG